MSTKAIGIALIVIGVLALAVSLLADYIGLGSGVAIIGWKQLLGAGLGLVVAIVGIVLALRKKKS
jgi:asparagine N-glycosylation enzyme membrane subunit Stt3